MCRERFFLASRLVLGVWCGLCGGTLYAFSAWEIDLMSRCQLNAQELESVYSAGQLGIGFGLIPGAIFDAHGPIASALYASVLLLCGNFGLAAALGGPKETPCSHPAVIAFLFGVVQNGSVALYQNALFVNLRAVSPASQGKVSGLIAAGNGLSAALWSGLFDARYFGPELSDFFTGTGMLFSTTAIIVALINFRRRAALASATPVSVPNSNSEDSHAINGNSEVTETDLGKDIENREGVARRSPERIPEPEKPKASKSEESGEDTSVFSAVRNVDYWFLVAAFSMLQGVGSGIFIANLSLIAESAGAPHGSAVQYVKVVSVCNCLGRLAVGVLGDLCIAWQVPRVAHILWTGGLAVAGILLALMAGHKLLEVLVSLLMMIGFAYGANWAVLPVVLSSCIRQQHVVRLYTFVTAFMSISVAFIAGVTGRLYDEAAEAAAAESVKHFPRNGTSAINLSGAHLCTGPQCFFEAYMMGLALSCLALLLGLVLYCRAVGATAKQDLAV